MFGLPNPWLILLLICSLGGLYSYGHHQGYQERVAEDELEITRLNTEARAKESELKGKLDVANSVLRKTKDDLKTKQSSLNALADSGGLRLPAASCVSADSGSSTQPGNTTNESESERKVVKDLIAIATDGDTAIISLNACIQQYNSVREIVNKGVK